MNAKNFLFFVVMFFSGLGANAQNSLSDLKISISDSFGNQKKISLVEYSGIDQDSLNFYMELAEKALSQTEIEQLLKLQKLNDLMGDHDNIRFVKKEGDKVYLQKIKKAKGKLKLSFKDEINAKKPETSKVYIPVALECRCKYYILAPEQQAN